MDGTNLTAWYLGFGIGAVCVFAVVVAVVVMLQSSSRIAVQLAAVVGRLAAIRNDASAVPTVRDINSDVRELNASLERITERLRDLLGASR